MSALSEVEHKLWVVESNGNPRSGKGTITGALADSFPGAAQDETGADYRAVTFGLLSDEIIDAQMPEDTIAAELADVGLSKVASYAAQRHEIVAEHGNDVLYRENVNTVVGLVAPLEIVRNAVKDGFAKRVQRKAEDPNTHFLFVDGRNLTPVIERVQGADLLLRLFIDCHPFAAAKREALRDGIDLSNPANETWFKKTLANIQARKDQDETRKKTP